MTTKDQDWLWIPGYENLYGVTRDGRVWGAKRWRSPEGWRKTTISIQGYRTIGLRKDGRTRTCSVARLVGFTYIPNPHNKPEINHIDGVKLNNLVENLEWVTREENQQHARRTGLHKNQAKGSKHGSAKLNERQVLDIRASDDTNNNLSSKYGVHPNTIADIRRGKEWAWLT